MKLTTMSMFIEILNNIHDDTHNSLTIGSSIILQLLILPDQL